jgi:serine/threonine-protein kinase
VKPSNIFLRSGPRFEVEPKLLDFGLARTMSDLRLTRSGMVLGTPLYMSPEQAGGEAVGPQTDVWSMGVVLFECLTGELPFVSRDSGAIAAQVLAGKVRSLNSVRPDLPVPLSNAVEKALRRDLSLRYRNMAEFARGLLVGATASDIRVPEDPDPVGFPDFSSWHGQAKLDTTVEVHKSEAPPAPADAEPRTSAAHELAVAATAVDTGSLPKRGFGKGVVVLAALVMLALVAVWFWSAQKPATEALEHPSGVQLGSTVTPPPPVQVAPVERPTVEPPQVTTSDSPQAQPAAATSQIPAAPPATSEKPSTHPKAGKRKAASATKPAPEQKPSDIEVEWK